MSLLTPEIGLFFWMFVSFGTVFFIGAKYGFPIILKMVNARKAYIDQSLEEANQAKKNLEKIKEEGDRLLKEVYKKRILILQEADEMRLKIIDLAKKQAKTEANQLIKEARVSIQKEKENAMRNIRSQFISLSMDIAEKILRKKLETSPEQYDYINKLIKELN